MPATLEAKEQTIAKVLGGDYLFEIPVYQRPYAWTEEQVGDLLEDLTYALGHSSGEPYFLGSIVVVKGTQSSLCQVVDGQQRLTTLTMLLCTIRDLQNISGLEDLILQKGAAILGTTDEFRLTLRPRDQEFFRRYVQSPMADHDAVPKILGIDPKPLPTDSQRQIVDNYKLLHRRLSQLGAEQLKDLAQYVVQQCYLVVVAASDSESAHRIFAVMNDRGLDLSPTDILKANVLEAMPQVQQEAYAEKWEEIEEQHGRQGFRDLFTHISMIYRKDKLRRNLQDEVQERVLPQHTATSFVDDVLTPYSGVFDFITKASYVSTAMAEDVNRYLGYLRLLDNEDWIPPVMAFALRHRGDSARLLSFLRDLERLAFGQFVLRRNVNDRIARYARVLEEIEAEADFSAPQSLLHLTTGECNEAITTLNGDIYSLTRMRLPLLLRLDSLLAGAGATFDHRIVTVEHVLPQNPSEDSEWFEWFPDEEVRNAWTPRLANLVLLSRSKNSQASNFSFRRKKHEYFMNNGVSPFALTTQVVNHAIWTPKELELRQRELVGALRKEWRLGQ